MSTTSATAPHALAPLRRFALLAVLAASVSPLAACATQPQQLSEEAQAEALDKDPWEPFNRAMFSVNNVLDGLILRPLASIYRGIVPEPGRNAVSRVLENLRSPVDFANSVLQGDPQNSFAVFWRFTINSTVGLGGIFDVAGEEAGLTARNADFGQTMAVYGMQSGPFLFLPILGPSSLRDATGRAVDMAFDPVTYAGDKYEWTAYAKAGANAIDFRARNMKLLDDINNTSLDPYATFRSGYIQRRNAEIRKALESRAQQPAAAPATATGGQS